MNDQTKYTIVKEVLDYFIRSNEPDIEQIKDSICSVTTAMMDAEWEASMSKGSQIRMEALNFTLKAELVLPLIFKMSHEECLLLIDRLVKEARKTLLALQDENNVSWRRKSMQALEVLVNTKEYDRMAFNECETFVKELEKQIETEDPENDEEYKKCERIVDEAGDNDYGHRSHRIEEALYYVGEKQTKYKALKDKYKHNKACFDQVQKYGGEVLLEEGYLIAPRVFEKAGIGIDIEGQAFSDGFKKAYTSLATAGATLPLGRYSTMVPCVNSNADQPIDTWEQESLFSIFDQSGDESE